MFKPFNINFRTITLGRKQQAAIVFTCAVLVYLSSLPNQFAFDDEIIIAKNPLIYSLDNIGEIFVLDYWKGLNESTNESGIYRPLTLVSYALNHACHELNPFGYHLVNVVLHAINSLIVFFLSLNFFSAKQRTAAFLTGVFFALHPIHTEAVANVVGRAELLYTFFYLAAWQLHIKLKTFRPDREIWGIAGVILLLLLSFFSKEMSITFIGTVILFDFMFKNDAGFANLIRTRWKYYIVYAVLTIAFLLFRFSLVSLSLVVYPIENYLVMLDAPYRVLNALHIIFFKYAVLLLFPYKLSPDYSHKAIHILSLLSDIRSVLTIILSIIACLVLIWSYRKLPIIFFAMMLIAITLSPVTNIAKTIGTIMAERLLYLPSLGFCILLAWFIVICRQNKRLLYVGLILNSLILIGYSARTVTRNLDWYNNQRLFTKALEVVPNSAKVHNSMATVYVNQGQYAAGIAEYKKAIAIDQRYLDPYFGLGKVYGYFGRYNEAIKYLKHVVEGNSDFNDAYSFLAAAYYYNGNQTAAIANYRLLADREIQNIEVYENLGAIYWQAGQKDSARLIWQQGLNLFPDYRHFRVLLNTMGDTTAIAPGDTAKSDSSNK